MLFNKPMFPLPFTAFPTVLLGSKWCLTWSFEALPNGSEHKQPMHLPLPV